MKLFQLVIAILTIVGSYSCSNDDIENSTSGIHFEYAASTLETTFRNDGSYAPVILDWNGDVGTFSISSPSEILSRGHIVIDENTGVISWESNVPLGEWLLIIEARNSNTTATVEITFSNKFVKGFFVGGFVEDTSDEPDYAAIPNEYVLTLKEGGTFLMENFDNSDLDFEGTWEANGSNLIATKDEETGVEPFKMAGFISVSSQTKIDGKYGTSISSEGEITDLKGIFRFELD
ncbi:hypothetical protein [Spongiivirga citrea]|uniref:Uncharacterized protein n=1 Tax=Spongiivirga citrea TaxID=1481457 RepID=A0A6M0CGS6_9FLAO|nr:hypothetical protein [Spongiivirga citrea]NER17071.1 hypothetical protein [Spongiivirga citrea]